MKNKKRWESGLTVGVILIALVALFFSAWNFFNSNSLIISGETGQQYPAIITGTTGDGDVEIVLTPSIQGGRLAVAAVFNTHSVDLSQFNLQEIVSLKYAGRSISPTEVFPLSGHHGSGKIIFKLDKALEQFAIIIIGMPNSMERNYNWS